MVAERVTLQKRNTQNIIKWADAIKPKINHDSERAQLSAILDQWNKYDHNSQEIIDLAARDAKTANEQMTALCHTDFEPLQAALESTAREGRDRAHQNGEDAQRGLNNARWMIVSALGLILVLIVGWSGAIALDPGPTGRTKNNPGACQRVARPRRTTVV